MACQIQLLGRFALHSASGKPISVASKKGQALIAIVGLAAGGTVPRERLSALLWSDRGEAQARNSLRQALTALRRDFAGPEKFPLRVDADQVSLDRNAAKVDALTFLELARSDMPDDLARTAALYGGDLLDGLQVHDPAFEDWLQSERRRFRRALSEVLSRLLAHQESAGQGDAAIATAERLLTQDPLNEAAHRALMRLFAGNGERNRALEQYAFCRDILEREASVAPEPATERLVEEIRTGRSSDAETLQRSESKHGTEAPAGSGTARHPLPDRPSIAVLPFTNLSGDPEQDYFAQGITQDIITELARFSSLQVVAQISAFELGDRARDPKSAGQVLGVRRLVTGNVRKAGNRVRVSVQLIDCDTGAHQWAERYDRELEDIFAIQDEVVHAIVTALGGRIAAVEMERALRIRPDKLEAYDYVLRCDYYLDLYDRESLEEGLRLAERAVTAAPSYARAYGRLAWFNATQSWFEPGDPSHLDRAREFASEAVKLDPSDGQCWQFLANIHLYRREFDQAERCNRQARACNPNDLRVVATGAEVLAYLGHWEEALEALRQFEDLEPLPPNWHLEVLGLIHFAFGRYSEACEAMTRMSALNYWNHARLAACYGHLGNTAKAQEHLKAFALEAPDPSIQGYSQSEDYFKNPEDREPWLEGLRKAGLKERAE